MGVLALGVNSCASPEESVSGKTTNTSDNKTAVSRLITPKVIVSGLNHPWGMAFIDEKTILITERNGSVQLYNGEQLQPISIQLDIKATGQGGLLDIKLSPNYSQDGYILMTYSKLINASLSTTALVRFKLDGQKAHSKEELFEATPYLVNPYHYGSRIAFDQSGYMYITLGDRYNYTTASAIDDPTQADAQRLNSYWGKVLRLNLDGSVPSNNPYAQQSEALSEIYSYGHRNPQGIAYDSLKEQLYILDHGPQGGDEINKILSGKNYGWPVITYGIDYNNTSVGIGTVKSGMEQPLHYWDPSIAPSSLLIYHGTIYPEWKGDWFVTALKDKTLYRISWDGENIGSINRMYEGDYGRLRNISLSPEGYLYLLVDDEKGSLIKLDTNSI